MELLVCGIHRSGTSAVAHMLSRSSNRTLLEDPPWAMTGRLIRVADQTDELAGWDILKCPRMTEVLPEASAVFPKARFAVLVRDPRDVLCSILEKVNAGMPTRMLEFSRIGVHERGAVGFSKAYGIYARTVLDTVIRDGSDRARVVVYENFWPDRPTTIAALAGWLGWPYDREVCEAIQNRQLGPLHTKHISDQSIKGAGRWSRELGADDRAALEPALEAYEALCAVA